MWGNSVSFIVLTLSICHGQSTWTDNRGLDRIISNIIQRVDELELAREQDKKIFLQSEEDLRQENSRMRKELERLRSKQEALEERIQQLEPCNIHLLQDPVDTGEGNSEGHEMDFQRDDHNTTGQGRFADHVLNRRKEADHRISAGPSVATVAFSSYLSQPTSNHVIDQPIVFDRVLLNAGGYYDGHTGTFTCRLPGIYVFFWAIGSDQGDWTQTDLVRNGQVVGATVSGDPSNGHESSGSNMVILNLFPNDRLWLNINSSHSPGPNNGIEPLLSSFSGFLLFY